MTQYKVIPKKAGIEPTIFTNVNKLIDILQAFECTKLTSEQLDNLREGFDTDTKTCYIELNEFWKLTWKKDFMQSSQRL